MQPKRLPIALTGILSLSLCFQPPLYAAGRAISVGTGGKSALPAAPAALGGTLNSSIKLSIAAPILGQSSLPPLGAPALSEPAPAIGPASPAAAPPSAPVLKKNEPLKKTVAAMKKEWGGLAASGAKIQESGSTGDSHQQGRTIETFLTGALPIASDLQSPLPASLHAEGLPPLKGLRAGPPMGLQPAKAAPARRTPVLQVAEPTLVDDRPGNAYRPRHPLAGFWKLLTLREAERPGLLGATLAAALLGPIPGLGAIALHEYGHYLLARLTGSGAASMHMFIPGGLPSGDGYVTLGFVKIGPPKTPLRNFILSAAGPAFSAAAFVALTLGVPAAAVAAVAYGWVPGEILPWFALGGAAAWAAWYWNAGKQWAFHGGKSDREHMDAARAEMFQYSNQAVRIGPLLGPPLAHLQVQTGRSAQDVLKHALELLDRYHAAADRDGWVTVEAGGKRFRFPLQTTKKAAAKEAAGYRPLPAPLIPTGEHWHQGEPDIVTLPLDAQERGRLRRHKRRLKYPWNSWVFYGALHLYASVLETEKTHGPVRLIPAR